MIEHRAKTTTRLKSAVFSLFGILVWQPGLPAAAETSTQGEALITVPIEIRFDLMIPCIENRHLDASMGMSADVYVDGHLDRSVTNHNGTGREQLELTVGSHEIVVTAEGYPEDRKTVMVRGNSVQKFAFHVRSGARIAVEVIRTHDVGKATRWMRKLRRKGQPATIRTIPPEGNEAELLAVQLGPLPTCEAAEQRIEFIEDEFDRASYIVPLAQ